MRTIIDITDDQVKALDEISELEGTSRAALIRQAIDRMLAEDTRTGELAQTAFGLWSSRKKDGLEIEASLRRGKVTTAAPQIVEAKSVIVQPITQPILAPVAEDLFMATAPEVLVENPPAVEVMKPPEPPKPAPREATLSSADPLAAFFAGGRT